MTGRVTVTRHASARTQRDPTQRYSVRRLGGSGLPGRHESRSAPQAPSAVNGLRPHGPATGPGRPGAVAVGRRPGSSTPVHACAATWPSDSAGRWSAGGFGWAGDGFTGDADESVEARRLGGLNRGH